MHLNTLLLLCRFKCGINNYFVYFLKYIQVHKTCNAMYCSTDCLQLMTEVKKHPCLQPELMNYVYESFLNRGDGAYLVALLNSCDYLLGRQIQTNSNNNPHLGHLGNINYGSKISLPSYCSVLISVYFAFHSKL